MMDKTRKEESLTFFLKAYEHQKAGQIKAAILNYKKSIEVYPTAEAHTFLGWTYSFLERFDQAIAECKKAIRCDPEMGNPYNDIGAYLIEKGCLDEAVPYLGKAMKAKDYKNTCFPHYNMGRIWERKGDHARALRSYKRSLKENPNYTLADIAVKKLEGMYN
jgi:Tfp pilus assembly protein PilF